MNMKFLSGLMILGFLLSVGSVYLNHMVFADSDWSGIAKRQQAAEQKALVVYQNKNQFTDTNGAQRDWSGLTSTATNETSRGRDIAGQEKVSLQNALAEFDQIHVKQLVDLQATNYTGLTNTPTDTAGRDRNTLIEQARLSSLDQSEQIINELGKIQSTYANFTTETTIEVSSYDRQVKIEKNLSDAEEKAVALVNSLAKIDKVYVNLDHYVDKTVPYMYKSGSITNELTHAGSLTSQQAYSLKKAIMIFNDIHEKHIAYLKSNYYGLTNTPTDTTGRDRNALIASAREVAVNNAMRVYNYNYGTSLK
jgi:hypothetical protein